MRRRVEVEGKQGKELNTDEERRHDRYVSREEFSEYVAHVNRRLRDLSEQIQAIITHPSSAATKAALMIGDPMAASTISVDSTTGKATLGFTDDHGDVTSAPAGLTGVTWSSDTLTVVTVAQDATDPASGDLTPVAVGSANITATPAGNYDNGTAIAPATAPVTVSAGAAASDALVVSG